MEQSSEKLEGAASLLEILENRANTELIAAARFVAARYMIKACTNDLDMTRIRRGCLQASSVLFLAYLDLMGSRIRNLFAIG